MLYSGADLIRTSGQQQDRVERLKIVPPVAPVENDQRQKSSLDQETQSALMRFARFIKDKSGEEKKREPRKPVSQLEKKNPYVALLEAEQKHQDRGNSLDIYI